MRSRRDLENYWCLRRGARVDGRAAEVPTLPRCAHGAFRSQCLRLLGDAHCATTRRRAMAGMPWQQTPLTVCLLGAYSAAIAVNPLLTPWRAHTSTLAYPRVPIRTNTDAPELPEHSLASYAVGMRFHSRHAVAAACRCGLSFGGLLASRWRLRACA